MQLVESVNDVKAFGGIAGDWSRSRPLTVFGPGEGERDEAINNILFPGCIHNSRVGRTVFCYSLERCPTLFNGIKGSFLVSVVCSFRLERLLYVILYV